MPEKSERAPKAMAVIGRAGMALRDALVALRDAFVGLISIAGPALGGIFLIPRPWIGAVLWFAITQDVRRAAFAVLGIAVGGGIGRVLGVSDEFVIGGGLKANAFLTAIAVAWLTAATGVSLQVQIAVAVGAAAAASILAAAIMRELKDTDLPSLVWAYCLVTGMLFVIFPSWTLLAVNATEPWFPPADALGWVSAYFRSLGATLFSPTLGAGLVVAIAILLWSRAVFVTGTIGWIAGAIAAHGFQNLGVTYYWLPTSYNFFIAGIGLGAVFFLPGRARLLLGAAGGCGASLFAVVLQHLFPGSAFAYLPISSALTIWIGIGAFALAGNRSVVWRNLSPRLPPEEVWLRRAYWSEKLGLPEPLLVVPVAGAVRVSQAFGGRLSHAGLWHYALDFQRPLSAGADVESEGSIWGAAVTAPAAGVVGRVKDDVADNPLGICNYADTWGNHVVIRLDQGGWALLAHLRQGTIAVKPGTRVEIGTYLGAVGNSGRSPVPHLHLQVQSAEEPGAPTVRFRLANYLSASGPKNPLLHWNAAAVPCEGAIVMAASRNPAVHSVLASIAPGSAVWVAESQGHVPRPFRQLQSTTTMRVNVALDHAGRHLFQSESHGTLVSGLDPDAWRVIDVREEASPFLDLLALVAPSIPYAAVTGMTWREPAPIIPLGAPHWLRILLSPYLRETFAYVHCTCISEPGPQGGSLKIETDLETRREVGRTSLPFKLTCQFEILRGPVRIEAAFEGGSLTYSQLSFEPGLPFNGGGDTLTDGALDR